jgi:hypothetical protein
MLGLKNFGHAAITITGVELLHRIRKGQFALGRLRMSGTAAPEIWNAVPAAGVPLLSESLQSVLTDPSPITLKLCNRTQTMTASRSAYDALRTG